MVSFKKVIDKLADLEHQQWMFWSKDIASKEKLSASRLERWKKYWKPFKKLSKEVKDQDREWAEKVFEIVPIKCPIWQCGGIMQTKERKLPNNDPLEYDGDWQTPDLICSNCGAIYQFQGFKKKRTKKEAKQDGTD